MNIGLIFDMDGVIVNNHRYHWKTWELLGAKYDIQLDEVDYRQNINGRTLLEAIRYIFRDKDMTEDELKAIGVEKEALYRKVYQPYLTPTKGLLQLLSLAGELNIPMVVGTSAPKENVHFTLDGLGIRHYFKAVLDDRSVTKGKPDPEIYQKCANAIGVPNERCVVFEDAIAGIVAGQAAGSKVVGLATSYTREELNADAIVDDFRQVSLELIEQLLDN